MIRKRPDQMGMWMIFRLIAVALVNQIIINYLLGNDYVKKKFGIVEKVLNILMSLESLVAITFFWWIVDQVKIGKLLLI